MAAATRAASRLAPRAIAPRPRLLCLRQASTPLSSYKCADRRTYLTDFLPPWLRPPDPDALQQTVHARLPVPYPASSLYDIIVDVDSYSSFLPLCHYAHVTRWTSADASGRRWPTQADLTAGLGMLEGTYTSRLFCHPGRLVIEAVSGDATTEFSREELRELGLRDVGHAAAMEFRAKQEGRRWEGAKSVFRNLYTRWTVQPLRPGDPARTDLGYTGTEKVDYKPRKGVWSDVQLSIKFQFADPRHDFVRGFIIDLMAETMVETFEKRARELLGRQPQGR